MDFEFGHVASLFDEDKNSEQIRLGKMDNSSGAKIKRLEEAVTWLRGYCDALQGRVSAMETPKVVRRSKKN